MRDYYIIYPSELEVVEQDKDEGGYDLESDSNILKARLKQEGQEFNKLSPYLTLKTTSGRVGGQRYIRRSSGGLMPRNFSKPFEFVYNYEEELSGTDFANIKGWYGQSSKGVKKYGKFAIGDLYDNYISTKYLTNPRCVSYKGDLLVAANLIDKETDSLKYVDILKFNDDGSSKYFSLVKRFKEHPVDINDIDAPEEGSPDLVAYKGELYLFYRSVDRGRRKNYFYCWKTSDEDYQDWELVSKTEIENTFTPEDEGGTFFDDFRLRAAANDETDSMMVVIFGVRGWNNQQIKDLRSFVSFDGGINFQTKQKDFNNVKNSSTLQRSKGGQSSGLFNFLIPNRESGSGHSDYTDFEPVFDLYFDKDMGSYVIISAGQPFKKFASYNLPNNCYLIGIKTSEGSFFDWDACLRQPVDYKMTGLSESNDPYDESTGENDYSKHAYKINDLCVVEGNCLKDLFLNVTENSSTNKVNGVVHSEFRFVNKNQIKKTDSGKVVAYGGKYHPQWIFSSSPINVQDHGLVSIGKRYDEDSADFNIKPFGNVFACRWRGQLFSSFKYNGELRGYTVSKVVSNVGEKFDYQHNYSRWLDSLENWGWEFNPADTEVSHYNWTRGSGTNELKITGDPASAYLELSDSSWNIDIPTYPHLIAAKAIDKVKVKFSVKIHSGLSSTNTIDFFKLILSDENGNGHSIILRLNNAGDLFVRNIAGTLDQKIEKDIDISKELDIIVARASKIDGVNNMFFWWKYNDEEDWNHPSELFSDINLYGSEESSLGDPTLQLGVIDYGTIDTQEVWIGDVQISSYGEGYRNYFSQDYINYPSSIEGSTRGIVYEEPVDYTAEPFKVFSNTFELHDGSEFELLGESKVGDETNLEYKRGKGKNSISNVLSGIANHGFDFTPYGSDFEVVFKRQNQFSVDALSLISLFGVYDFVVTCGDWSTVDDGWDSAKGTETETYPVPFLKLDVENTDGSFISLTDQEFSEHLLDDQSVLLYDTSTDTWEDQFFIVNNFDDVIELNKDVPSLTDKELRLMVHSGSFDIPEKIGDTDYTHFSITFKCPTSLELASVGEVSFGKLVDISDYVESAEYSTEGNFDNIESDIGLLYPSLTEDGNTYEELDLELTGLRKYDASSQKVLDVFTSLYKSYKPFPILHYQHDGSLVTEYGIINEGFDFGASDYTLDSLSTTILIQDYKPLENSEVENLPPQSFQIYASETDVDTSTSVTFLATAQDPEGENVTFEWDFGDGSTATGINVSNTFSSLGVYTVKCTASDESGASAERRIDIYVNQLGIDSYDIVAPSGVGHDVAFDIDVTAKDKNNNTVTHNDSMSLYIEFTDIQPTSVDVDVSFDSNEDGTWSETDTEDTKIKLSQGTGKFVSKIVNNSGSSTTVTYKVTDEIGREYTFDVQQLVA